MAYALFGTLKPVLQTFVRIVKDSIEQAQAQRAPAQTAQETVQQWWKVLGVSRDASVEAIKAAYRKKAKQFHPDLSPDKKGNPAEFHRATEAYDEALKHKKR